ncbi:MAG: hypothetical protein ACRC8S_15140 [Fimbriiglobus sp.]
MLLAHEAKNSHTEASNRRPLENQTSHSVRSAILFYIPEVTHSGSTMSRVSLRPHQVDFLPPLCVCCGKNATQFRQQEFRLNPALSGIVLVLGLLVAMLITMNRSVTLRLPVCEYHRRKGRRSNKTFFQGLLLTVAIGLGAYAASFFDATIATYVTLAAVATFVLTFVVAMFQGEDGLSASIQRDGTLNLNGVCQPFADATRMRMSLLDASEQSLSRR